MTIDITNFVRRAVKLTGAEQPGLLKGDSPALIIEDNGFYMIGLIGGKDVGKSSLINALVGRKITQPVGYGEGTAGVFAYAHSGQVEPLRERLNCEVPGKFTIIPHDNSNLSRQVILDLPDIDSNYSEHREITRKILRHILYPLWIQSIEKYADQAWHDLLRQVAEGNSPENFLFCLNKADKISATGKGRDGKRAENDPAAELREDFAKKLVDTLSLKTEPKVWLISAKQPDKFDLPELSGRMAQQLGKDDVDRSRKLAARQRDRSILAWFDERGFPDLLVRIKRLEQDGRGLLSERLEQLVVSDAALGRLDSAAVSALADDLFERRVRCWPIVSMIHVLLNPLLKLLIAITGSAAGRASAATSAAASIQGTFANLQQLDPLTGELYHDNKLWEQAPAEQANDDLFHRMTKVARQQLAELRESLLPGRWSFLLFPWRWLLTIGTLLWFPLIQPVLETFLTSNNKVIDVPLLLVKILSVSTLLRNVLFLLIWYIILWVCLRGRTQQLVQQHLGDRRDGQMLNPTVAAALEEWSAVILNPMTERRLEIESLLADAEKIRAGQSAA